MLGLLVGCSNPTGSDDGGDGTSQDDSVNGDQNGSNGQNGSDGGSDLGGTYGPVEAALVGVNPDQDDGATRVSVHLSTGGFSQPGVGEEGSDVVTLILNQNSEVSSVDNAEVDLEQGGSAVWTASALFGRVDYSDLDTGYEVTGGTVTVDTGNFIGESFGSDIDLTVSGSLEVRVYDSSGTIDTATLQVDYSGTAELVDPNE
mgnify:CR=1 FL=1